MTKENLKQYRSLVREIEDINKKISECKSQATVKASSLAFPYTQHVVTVSGYCYDKKNRILKLKNRRAECISKCREIEDFIYSIENSQIKQIFEHYYIDGRHRVSWQQVADKIGEHDESYPRKKHNKYLSDLNKVAEFSENNMVQSYCR